MNIDKEKMKWLGQKVKVMEIGHEGYVQSISFNLDGSKPEVMVTGMMKKVSIDEVELSGNPIDIEKD